MKRERETPIYTVLAMRCPAYLCAPLQLLWLKGIGALETNFNGAARISPELLGASCSDGQEG